MPDQFVVPQEFHDACEAEHRAALVRELAWWRSLLAAHRAEEHDA